MVWAKSKLFRHISRDLEPSNANTITCLPFRSNGTGFGITTTGGGLGGASGRFEILCLGAPGFLKAKATAPPAISKQIIIIAFFIYSIHYQFILKHQQTKGLGVTN